MDLDLADHLLKKRVVVLSGDCDGRAQQNICASIIGLNVVSAEDPITLYIDSGGGGIYAGMHLYDVITKSAAPVTGVVVGRAVSAAFNTLQACHVRQAMPHAILMNHSPELVCLRIDQPDLEKELKERRDWHELIISRLVERGKVPRAQFELWSQEERYFNAQESLEFGMIDEII
jgi:ATP-dependent Clp protease protease subunit